MDGQVGVVDKVEVVQLDAGGRAVSQAHVVQDVVVLLEVLAILLGRRLLLLVLGGTLRSLADLPSLANASEAEHDNLGAQDFAMEQPHEEGFGEADAPLDASDGNLQVVHLTILIRSCQAVSTEGAEQQGQEQVQDLESRRGGGARAQLRGPEGATFRPREGPRASKPDLPHGGH